MINTILYRFFCFQVLLACEINIIIFFFNFRNNRMNGLHIFAGQYTPSVTPNNRIMPFKLKKMKSVENKLKITEERDLKSQTF